MNFLEVFILALIEGLTEFLPVSSTGHMVIASYFMGLSENNFVKSFEVIIQFGAICAVLVLYKKRFLSGIEIYKKLIASFIPTGIVGFLLKNSVDSWLGSISVVAISLIVGGFVFIISDKWLMGKNSLAQRKEINQLTMLDCVKLGLFQCLALIPGVSRSGATIIGGLILNLEKSQAAEYSFLLAVPTMAAATLYKSYKIIPTLQKTEAMNLIFGLFIAYVVAYYAIKTFIAILSKYGFSYFGYYRIILGTMILFF